MEVDDDPRVTQMQVDLDEMKKNSRDNFQVGSMKLAPSSPVWKTLSSVKGILWNSSHSR